MFIAGTEPSEVSNRFSKLSDPYNGTYALNGNNLTLSWTSPGIPDAISNQYLTEYFKEGYTIWAEDYLDERLDYNKDHIGDFGFAVYLTNGTSSTYLGWTRDTSYTVDLTKYTGTYDGYIVKSAYSIFKNNASDGIKILFENKINEEIYDVTLNGLTSTLNVNDTYIPLDTSSISTITLNGADILQSVTELKVTLSSLSSAEGPIEADKLTLQAGTYTAKYDVSFMYNLKPINKTFTQTITVN